jgi:hypothetical protein
MIRLAEMESLFQDNDQVSIDGVPLPKNDQVLRDGVLFQENNQLGRARVLLPRE